MYNVHWNVWPAKKKIKTKKPHSHSNEKSIQTNKRIKYQVKIRYGNRCERWWKKGNSNSIQKNYSNHMKKTHNDKSIYKNKKHKKEKIN